MYDERFSRDGFEVEKGERGGTWYLWYHNYKGCRQFIARAKYSAQKKRLACYASRLAGSSIPPETYASRVARGEAPKRIVEDAR